MNKTVDKKKMEQIARRMGYDGPMNKFAEFLMSSPRGYAEGGVVKARNTTTTNSNNQTFTTPTEDFNTPEVTTTPITPNPNQFIASESGQLPGPISVAPVATGSAVQATAPNAITAATYDPSMVQPGVEDVINQYTFAQGSIAPESTVQGQMANLMDDFEGGATPAWAAGAMRAADANSLARGIGSSSMAAAATTQAAMESAIPIAMQDANTFAQMQFQNLNNEQQALMLANTARTNALFTDIAAENVAKQFNATSENQVRQFNESLKTSVDMFNAEQVNAMRQFNAGQINAMTQFKASLINDRQKFNSTNQLIVDQANAKWRQEIATINNANINEANRIEAGFKMDATLTEMNAYFQERRDTMQYAYENGENEEDRALQLLMSQMSLDEVKKQTNQASKDNLWATVGALTAEIFR